MITTEGPLTDHDADPAQPIPVLTVQARSVLLVLLQQPQREMFGSDIANRAGLYRATVCAILRRLHRAGWVVRREESAEEKTTRRGKRPRRFYRLTPNGAHLARQALAPDLPPPMVATSAGRLGLTRLAPQQDAPALSAGVAR